MHENEKPIHISVLLEETINGLNIKKGGVYVDATCGFGGHSLEIAKRVSPDGTIIVFDKDSFALNTTKEKLSEVDNINVLPYHGGFENIKKVLESMGVEKIDGIMFDLGVSSYQLDSSKRGFSFRYDEPLLMTLSDETKDIVTAYDVVNSWSEETLEVIIKVFGEERFYRRIVAGIVSARNKKPIETTFELKEIVENSIPYVARKKSKIHPATKTFQAIRIAVNQELTSLEDTLRDVVNILNKKGRMAVISFHSLEDRIVKNEFNNFEKSGLGKKITKKPIVPTEEEIIRNPRSRSAKLRIFEKND